MHRVISTGYDTVVVVRLSCVQLLDMKIFVDTDSDIRLVRRLRRDITERGRDIGGVIKQYNKYVKPAFDQYIEPTMRLADIVVPRGECHCLLTFVRTVQRGVTEGSVQQTQRLALFYLLVYFRDIAH